ncbi:uncharacterized protein LOC125369526 [Ricinus communis]|uniref:uncharacterized protein LOC125369526 n=1 Tax=Ricinus communis TaxID=3988 RepID=UPI00201A707B|nr:uncharacterized protein LOC125369526 [Ricinus communis]
MDFVLRLPRTLRKHDAIWIIIDRLMKLAHFLPVQQSDSLDKLAEIYVPEIVRLHGVPTSIMSDRDPRYHSSIGMAPYEALYGRRYRSPVCWDMDGLRQLEGPKLIQEIVDKIQIVKKCLKAAQDRQKIYVDKHRREMEYEVGEKVFLRVSPWKGIIRFGKQGKLSPRYRSDPSHIVQESELQLTEDLSYKEELVRILDRQVKKLRNKEIPIVKIKWSRHSPKEATWEVEKDMRVQYPYLFSENGDSL